MRKLIPLIPYLAVAVGMYGMRNAWAALGFYHTGILAALILIKHQYTCECRYPVHPVWMPTVTFIFALGGVVLYILWPQLSPDSHMITSRLADYGINYKTWPCFAAYFCIVNSTLEELFWRGCLGSDTPYPVANDFLFGGYHVFVLMAFTGLIWGLPVLIACAFAAWLWRMLRRTTGGLTVPMITHIVADMSIAAAVYLRAFA